LLWLTTFPTLAYITCLLLSYWLQSSDLSCGTPLLWLSVYQQVSVSLIYC